MSTVAADVIDPAANPIDEQRLRELASGIAKDIEDVGTLLKRGGFTPEDYEELCGTRAFRGMLEEAYSEWQGANNTPKRVKLKAAINIELALPSFYSAMVNPQEPLSSRVKAFEIMARVGGLGNPEPVATGAGNAFNLTIQLTGGGALPGSPREIVVGGMLESVATMEMNSAQEVTQESYTLSSLPARTPTQSPLFAALPFEEF